MAIPPMTMAVAISRRISIFLVGCHSRNVGDRWLRMRANTSTNIGRPLVMVATRETGPLCNAQNDSIIPVGTSVSLRMSRRIVELRCFMLSNCLITWRRSEMSRKMTDIQSALIQNMFQNEI